MECCLYYPVWLHLCKCAWLNIAYHEKIPIKVHTFRCFRFWTLEWTRLWCMSRLRNGHSTLGFTMNVTPLVREVIWWCWSWKNGGGVPFTNRFSIFTYTCREIEIYHTWSLWEMLQVTTSSSFESQSQIPGPLQTWLWKSCTSAAARYTTSMGLHVPGWVDINY